MQGLTRFPGFNLPSCGPGPRFICLHDPLSTARIDREMTVVARFVDWREALMNSDAKARSLDRGCDAGAYLPEAQQWLCSGLNLLEAIPDGLEGGIRMQQATLALQQAMRCGLAPADVAQALRQAILARLIQARQALKSI